MSEQHVPLQQVLDLPFIIGGRTKGANNNNRLAVDKKKKWVLSNAKKVEIAAPRRGVGGGGIIVEKCSTDKTDHARTVWTTEGAPL